MEEIQARFFFCDDVRHETSGKVSIIGLYRGYIGILQAIPFVPKIVCLVLLDFPQSLAGAPIAVSLRSDDDVLLSETIPLPSQRPGLAAGSDDGSALVEATIPVELIGYEFPNGKSLTCAIDFGGKTIVSSPLKILRLAEPPRG